MKDVDLAYVTIRYKAPVVYMVFKEDAELGFPEMLELIRCAEELSGRTPYLTLADVRQKVTVTPEGRKVSADASNSPFHRGTAVVVKNNLFKIAANFFSDIKKPRFPFQAFTSEKEAIDWLLQLPLEN